MPEVIGAPFGEGTETCCVLHGGPPNQFLDSGQRTETVGSTIKNGRFHLC